MKSLLEGDPRESFLREVFGKSSIRKTFNKAFVRSILRRKVSDGRPYVRKIIVGQGLIRKLFV